MACSDAATPNAGCTFGKAAAALRHPRSILQMPGKRPRQLASAQPHTAGRPARVVQLATVHSSGALTLLGSVRLTAAVR